MFPYYLLPGNKPKPRKPSSYLPSYLTVYVKPDPKPAQAGIPDDILPFVNPNPKPVSQPKRRQYDPLSSIQVRKRESGNKRSSSSRVSQSERTVRIRTGENPGPREIVPDKSLRDIADVPVSGIDPADLKFYFAARDHDLVRSVEAALTHEGLPARYETEPATYPRDYFAEYGMDAEADAAAEAYTRKYAEEMGLQRAQEVTREVIEDLSNDEMESVVAVDRDTGEIIFVRYGDEDSVTLQEEQRKLAEGRNIVLIHNHWNNSAASLADLGAADWLDAERLVVVTPSGEQYYYHRRGGKLVALKPIQGPGAAAESDPVETAVARLLHMMQSAREAGNPAEWVMRQGPPAVTANSDVNVDEISRYDELARFVAPNMERAAYLELLKDEAAENPDIIRERMNLLENIFGYNVEFKQTYSPEAAIEQVYNLASILFYFLNDLGIEVMRSTPDKTNYYLGANDELRVFHGTDQPEYRGHVALPESADARLEDVYLGSLITRGAIAHEVSHEIDRRAGVFGTVRVELKYGPDGAVVSRESEEGPVGSFHWFLENRVPNQQQPIDDNDGYNFLTAVSNLRGDSRAALQAELGAVREIFADLLAAKVLDPLDEDFYSTAYDNAQPIGFRPTYGAADVAIAMEQYFDQYADYLEIGTPNPEAFDYIKYHNLQRYNELQWPVIPVHGDEE